MKFTLAAAICLLILIHDIQTASVVSGSEHRKTVEYLKAFGYLPQSKNNKEITHKEFKHALKQLQENGHIPQTGKIDDDTINLMLKPRCGVPDNNLVMNHRKKRYDLLSTKWERNELTWNLNPHPYNADEEKIKRALREAFRIWSEHSMLVFNETKKHDDADIRISFQKPKHINLDPYELDSSTLAHAFQPGTGVHGDAHFKLDGVNWDFDVIGHQVSPAPGKASFFSVALHELGHSMGLGHSPYEDAVMYPYSLGAGILSKDDIKGIQHIYGVPKTSTYPTTPSDYDDDRPIWDTRPKVNDTIDKCLMSYDAIATLGKARELFIFKGKYLWRPQSTDTNAIEIHQFFEGLPSNLTHVDAVYENSEGKILLFIHQKLYVYNWRWLEKDEKIKPYTHIGLRDVKSVDFVFRWPYNNIVYLFAGDHYWRFDEKLNVILQNTQRLTKRAFKDVYDMETVFVRDKKTYFFKGLYFYEFDDRIMRLHRMKPMVSASVFMGCDLPKTPPPVIDVESRFGDDIPSLGGDIINEAERVDEIPDDKDNPEKQDNGIDPKSPDHAANIEIMITIIVASLIISQLSPSILLT